MHRLINEIIVALENNEYCTALFIDIEKAFDKINHESLLQTIRKQFPEQLHQLIKSYISNTIKSLHMKLHIKSIVEKIQKTRRQMHWLTSRKSKLSVENKLKIYKTIIKPIWTYGIPLWWTAAMRHINKIEVIQAKILRTIINGPWYVRNKDIRRDLGIPTVKEEISRYSEKYKSRIATHPNRLAAETYKTINMDRRLKRKHPADLIKDIT